jgi:hypothetical protein
MKVIGVLLMAGGVMLIYWTFKGSGSPAAAGAAATGGIATGSAGTGSAYPAPGTGSGARPGQPQ